MNLKKIIISLLSLQATEAYSNDDKKELNVFQRIPENSIVDLINKLNKNNKIELRSQTEIRIIEIESDNFKERFKNIFTNYFEVTIIATISIVSSVSTFAATRFFYKKCSEKMINNSAKHNMIPGYHKKLTPRLISGNYLNGSSYYGSESSDNDSEQLGKNLHQSIAANNENISTPKAKNTKNPALPSLQRVTRSHTPL